MMNKSNKKSIDGSAEGKAKIHSKLPHQNEGLSKEDYNELIQLVNEPAEKETVTYNELKSTLSRWFVK